MKCPAEVSQVGELGLIHTSCCADQQPTSLSHSTQIHSPLRKSKATRFLALSVRKWRACSQLCGLVAQSCPTLCDPMDCSPPGSSIRRDSPGKNTGVGCRALLQGIFPTRDRTQVSHIVGRFFTIWATRKAQRSMSLYHKFDLIFR